ncbi:MAG TPA: response regulator [Pilimelia sp.]|nr:response regulator [Pilimelia sp.]
MAEVLVVEDDQDIRTMLATRLERAGFGVTTAPTAVDALAAVREHRPDAVLLDVQLPGMSGLEFCRRVRADEALADILVVVATASVGPGAMAAAFEAGADEFVTKPFQLADLIDRLRSATPVRPGGTAAPTAGSPAGTASACRWRGRAA